MIWGKGHGFGKRGTLGELLRGVVQAEHSLNPTRLTLADAKANPSCILFTKYISVIKTIFSGYSRDMENFRLDPN